MSSSVSTILSEHRTEIVERWIDVLRSTDGTSYFARPVEQLRGDSEKWFDAVMRAVSGDGRVQIREFINEISPAMAGEGYGLAEVQRALLDMREAIWPFLAEEYRDRLSEFISAARTVDACLNRMVYEFAEVYRAQISAEPGDYVREVERANRRLRQIASRDGLTGLFNRKYFEDRLRSELRRAERYQHQTSLLMIDIDRFKQVNDQYGHQMGDTVLVQAAEIIRHNIRDADIAARYGGEEFVVILPETDKDRGAVAAERVRKAIESATTFASSGTEASLTVSIGLAQSPEDADDAEQLIVAADRALYLAKELGRNRVAGA